jgi:hypothetical protein
MTESQVVNEWISQGEAKGKLEVSRQKLLRLVQRKFPEPLSEEVSRLILQQDSMELLDAWFDTAISAQSLAEFIAALRQ